MNLASTSRIVLRLPTLSSGIIANNGVFVGNKNILTIQDSVRKFSTRISAVNPYPFSSSVVAKCTKRSWITYPSGIWSKPRLSQLEPKNQWLFTVVRLNHNSPDGNDNLERGNDRLLPPLMPFQPIVWPRFMNAIRNWFFINFIIKPYFDKEFNIMEFISGAKAAASIVANKLSEGKLDELEGLVDPSALFQLRESLSRFTVFQQQLLRVAAEDIFFAFPYQIGIIIPDEVPSVDQYAEGVQRPPQTRHVEITVCLHVLRGFAEKQRLGETGQNFNFFEFSQDERNKYNVMICNYRFFKDFTEGSPDPSWIINMVNHFLPMELNRK